MSIRGKDSTAKRKNAILSKLSIWSFKISIILEHSTDLYVVGTLRLSLQSNIY